jgi:cytochrome d ubiquinol oxidase subunit II
MLTMHGAIWLQVRADVPIASRAKAAVRVFALSSIAVFALAGVWLVIGVEGFRVVSMPALDATPNPLTKEVVQESWAWLANYGAYPWTLLFPLLGFGGLWMTLRLAAADRPGWGLVTSSLALTGIIMTAGVSLFPFILPSRTDPNSSLIVWDAVSSHLTLTVMFWAAVIFIPLILAYTTWTYRRMWRLVTVKEIEEQEHLAY